MGIQIHATKFNDTNMPHIDTCTIVIDISYIGRTGVLIDAIHYLEQPKKRLLLLRRHKGTCNSVPLSHLDKDGGTTAKSWLSQCFYGRICFLSTNETWIHNTLIVVDRYSRFMGDTTIPASAEPRQKSFYPPLVAGIDLPHQREVDSYNPFLNASLKLENG